MPAAEETVAVKVADCPYVAEPELGVTTVEVAAFKTVSVSVGLVTPSKVAVIAVVPPVSAEARPDALIVATDGVADAQVTWLVRSTWELSV